VNPCGPPNAPSLPAAFRATPHQLLPLSVQRPISSCRFPCSAPSAPAAFGPWLHPLLMKSDGGAAAAACIWCPGRPSRRYGVAGGDGGLHTSRPNAGCIKRRPGDFHTSCPITRGTAAAYSKRSCFPLFRREAGPFVLAVTVGFEPTLAFTPNNISSVAPSAARTRHQPQ
jgi:hypothetical protein